jgi:hypothetical protein
MIMRIIAWVRGACLAGTLALPLSACGGAAASQSTPTPTQTPVTSCLSKFTSVSVGYEAQGVIHSASGADVSGAQLWVLMMYTTSAQLGQPDYVQGKFVWRMTGHGDFHVLALGPHGEQLAPKDGPTAHLGSTWDTHPGDEWGTIMTFSSAGCWIMRAWRDDVSGDVTLLLK